MPELPEVETMRRGIAHVAGAKIVSVQRTPSPRRPISITPRIDRLNCRAAGQRIASVDRLGKRVVLRLESDDRIVIEPRMTGLVLIGKPPTTEHLRLRITLSGRNNPDVLFWDQRGLGVVTMLSADDYHEKLMTGKIGPDACEIVLDDFLARVGDSQSAIKVVLLDQSRVAGIGNLYASEMLHVAGIDPRQRANRLNRGQWQRLHTAMQEILNAAIEFEGSTLSDGTYRNALNEAGNYQSHHRVYDRAGEPCKKCGPKSKIVRIVQAQRSTFWCSQCQKKR